MEAAANCSSKVPLLPVSFIDTGGLLIVMLEICLTYDTCLNSHFLFLFLPDDFKPASIDTACEGELEVGKGEQVSITLPNLEVSILFL